MSKIWVIIRNWIWKEGELVTKADFLGENDVAKIIRGDNDISTLANTLEDKVKEALREAGVDLVTIEKVMEKL